MISRRSCKVHGADAICIKQHGRGERSQQVSLVSLQDFECGMVLIAMSQVRSMENIYSYSCHTIIWLGEFRFAAEMASRAAFRQWNDRPKASSIAMEVRLLALTKQEALREQGVLFLTQVIQVA